VKKIRTIAQCLMILVASALVAGQAAADSRPVSSRIAVHVVQHVTGELSGSFIDPMVRVAHSPQPRAYSYSNHRSTHAAYSDAPVVVTTLVTPRKVRVDGMQITVAPGRMVVIIKDTRTPTGYDIGVGQRYFSIRWYGEVTTGIDVKALQQELERLGIKVKPKPPIVKETRSISS